MRRFYCAYAININIFCNVSHNPVREGYCKLRQRKRLQRQRRNGNCAQTSAVRTVTTTKADPDVTRTNYVITVTTGAGFYTGGYITTGTYSDDSGYYDYSDNSTGNDYSDGSWQQDEEEDYYYPLPGETSTSYDDNNTTPSDSYIDQPATEPATDYVPPTEYIPDDSGSQGTDYSGGDSSYSDGTGQSEW